MPESGVGARISRLRRERGWSQAALASATGVSRSAVAQWETDRAGQFSGNLARIASVLDVSIEVLLHGTGSGQASALIGDELALLRLYRECDDAGRAELLRSARRLAKTVSSGTDTKRPPPAG